MIRTNLFDNSYQQTDMPNTVTKEECSHTIPYQVITQCVEHNGDKNLRATQLIIIYFYRIRVSR